MELTKEKIEELKAKYGKIFKVNVSGADYVYRGLSRGEFRAIQAKSITDPTGYDASQGSIIEEEMVKTCLIYPEGEVDMDALPAGVPSLLSNYISEASGFNADAIPEEL